MSSSCYGCRGRRPIPQIGANDNISRLQNTQSANGFCKRQDKALDQNNGAPMVVAYSTFLCARESEIMTDWSNCLNPLQL